MSRRSGLWMVGVALTLSTLATGAAAQETPGGDGGGAVVEVTPARAEARVGETLQFRAAVQESAGRESRSGTVAWFASPFDLAAADQDGNVTFHQPGNVQVTALIDGRVGQAVVEVHPAAISSLEIQGPAAPLVVGGSVPLEVVGRGPRDIPRRNVPVTWSSSQETVATVDAAGLVRGVGPGHVTIRAAGEGAEGVLELEVVENPVLILDVHPGTAQVRTGEVVRFDARATGQGGQPVEDAFVRWTVSGGGARIEPDGAFVAERPGTYAITAASGDRIAVASVVVKPRGVQRRIEVVGRIPFAELQVSEQWIIGDHAYVATVGDRVRVYDVSDPARPVLTDSLMVDARHVNDVSTTADGKIGVLTRENATTRRNGIVFFDASDPAHPKVVSEYTETVTGGVHSAFIDGHHVYLTDDATGSMRVIDFSDVENPREVARWQVENPLARTYQGPNNVFTGGRYLHDLQVLDGLAYLAYWRDGLIILDVGNGMRGGSPENPQLVSQLKFNHHELYGPDWLAGTHTVFRHEDHVFVGDEVFPGQFNIQQPARIPPRGILHVVDVSDIENPRKVAEYAVPEAGAHNVWVEDDVLMMGYYEGGGRVVDVSGELRGDLYTQGREIASLWTGHPEGFRPNLALAWGAQPHDGLIYFNDMNSGVWIARLGEPMESGSTTSPPQ
ncbi:MAG: Ig-like domain-containing protein [Gemmatimonadota bacterium]